MKQKASKLKRTALVVMAAMCAISSMSAISASAQYQYVQSKAVSCNKGVSKLGGTWKYAITSDGYVQSHFYHKSKQHRAGVYLNSGKNSGWTFTGFTDKGKWADRVLRESSKKYYYSLHAVSCSTY